MKTFKIHLHLHIEPIYRDLLLVSVAGILIAVALISIVFMIFH